MTQLSQPLLETPVPETNFSGFYTLFYKEVLRFWKVGMQTILAPVITALLYLLIFAQALGQHVETYAGVSYTAFLVPGLVMMAMLQNAFANPSSSLIQSKITGNIVFVLLPPLSHYELFFAYTLAAVVRGVVVGAGVLVVGWLLTDFHLVHPWWVITFTLLGCSLLGSLGLIAGIYSEKFDQLAGFQNFLITPLTFLAGVFYSLQSLSPFWRTLSHFNPFFYLIDGFRYGFFDHADVNPWVSFLVACVSCAVLFATAITMLARGYKLRR